VDPPGESSRAGWRRRPDHQPPTIPAVYGRDESSIPTAAVPTRAADHEASLRDHIRTPLGSAFPVAVVNLKGGVGKTVVVEALGSTLAEVRDDRIIAVDLDEGDLMERHGAGGALSMAELVANNTVTRYADVRAYSYANASGLEVLGPQAYSGTGWRPARGDVVKVFSLLRNHYSVVLLDCAKGLTTDVMKAVLPEAQALVVVASASEGAVRRARTTLEWLSHNGYRRLTESAVLAVNHVEPAKLDAAAAREVQRLQSQLSAAVMLPFDRHFRDGEQITLAKLSRNSRRAYLDLAAALADVFPNRSVAHQIGRV
jgi:chromosome partitioning protein